MRRYRHHHLCLAFWLSVVHHAVIAQVPTIDLESAEVVGINIDPGAGWSIRPDSLVCAAITPFSLGEILQAGSTLNLRMYGPTGTLVTGGGRGLPSDHLAVYWLGTPLNSPTLGLVDLSAIPGALFDHPLVQSANSSTRSPHGGAIGSIHLSGPTRDGLMVGSGVDNLNNLNLRASASFQINEKWRSSTRYQGDWSSNDFTYNDPYLRGNPERSQERNGFQRDALIQEFTYRPHQNWSVETGIWLQASALEIPDIMGKYGSRFANQRDSSIRVSTSIRHQTAIGNFSLNLARFSEFQHYEQRQSEEGALLIDSRITTHRNFSQLRWSHHVLGFVLEAGADVSIESAHSNNHGSQGAERTLTGGQVRLGKAFGNTSIRSGFRYDSGPGASVPVPEIQIRQHTKVGAFFLGARRVFRYPDLNQLFWVPGGDPDLIPEKGFSTDAGWQRKWKAHGKSLSLQTNVYHQRMQALILWVNLGEGLQARNIRDITSTGFNGFVELVLPIGRMVVRQQIESNLQHVDGLGAGDRLFFPVLQSRYSLFAIKNGWFAGIALRYIANELRPSNLNTMSGAQDAVLLGDAYFGIEFKVSEQPMKLALSCRNIGDVLDFRVNQIATPGRVIALNFSMNLFNLSLR